MRYISIKVLPERLGTTIQSAISIAALGREVVWVGIPCDNCELFRGFHLLCRVTRTKKMEPFVVNYQLILPLYILEWAQTPFLRHA
jgi:hypothetical protein